MSFSSKINFINYKVNDLQNSLELLEKKARKIEAPRARKLCQVIKSELNSIRSDVKTFVNTLPTKARIEQL